MDKNTTQGHRFSGIEIHNSTVVLGNIQSHGGVTINSKAATSTDVTGQTTKSLRPVATYVARPSLYNQLKARLHDTLDARGPSSKIVVVCGLGGAGKSQLVLHYVHIHRQDYAAVFWIEAGSKSTLERDYIQIWRLLSRSREEKIGIDDAILGVKAWLQEQPESRKWLVVLDSADNIDDEAHKDYIDLSIFIPDAACVDVVVTTRSQSAKDMTEIEEVQVGELDEEEALQLLLRCSKLKIATDEQKHEAALIVKELGHFALAVALAGAYISATPRIRSRLDSYVPEYRQQRKALLGRKALRHVHQYGESVLTTWETSYAAVASQCPEALGLLQLIAYLSCDDIFHKLFAPLLNTCSRSASMWSCVSKASDTNDAITQGTLDAGLEVLAKYSLLTWKEEQSSYAMHKLVHTWGFDRMSIEEQSQRGQDALVSVSSLLTWQTYKPQMRARLLPHFTACFSRLQEWYGLTRQIQASSLESLAACCDFLRDNGHYAVGIEVCSFRCDACAQMSNDNDQESVLHAEHTMAQMYWHLGQWEKAEELDGSVLGKRQRLLGEEHPDTLTSMSNLASTYNDQGRYDDAAELGVKVLEIRKRVLGAEHPDTLSSMNNLALTYRDQGRFDAAAELGTKVLEIGGRVLGEEHPSTLTSMGNLALTYTHQGRYEQAAELGVEVLEIWQRVLGEEHPDTLTSMGILASTYRHQGRYEQAAELEVRELTISKRVLGEEHPSTLTSICNLALTYRHEGRYDDAAELGAKVLEIRKRVLGEEHPSTLISMNNLALTRSDQGRYEQAAELGVKVVEISKRVLGEEHPDTLTSICNLALTYRHEGRYHDAAELCAKVLEIRKRVLGEEHPSTLISINNLASAYSKQGRFDDAAMLEVKVAEIMKRVLGEEHPHTLTSMNNLAVTFFYQDRLQEACELMAQCLHAQIRVLGETHPNTTSSASWLQTIEGKCQAGGRPQVRAKIGTLDD